MMPAKPTYACSRFLFLFSFLAGCIFSLFASQPAHTASTPENTPGPNNIYSGSSFSGTATYAQVNSTSSSFSVSNGALTLTGNQDNALLTGRARTITIGSDGEANLILLKGTLDVTNLNAWSRTGAAFLQIGGGSTDKRETVTINGSINGIPQGATNASVSNLIINGSDLVVNGRVGGGSGYVGYVTLLNGNLTINTPTNGSNEFGVLTVAPGLKVISDYRVDIHRNVNLGAKSELNLTGSGYLWILSQLNRNDGKGMEAGSSINSIPNIEFHDYYGNGGGINGASGTIHSDGYIQGMGRVHATGQSSYFDLLQGDGSLTLSAGDYITARDINADTISAGTYIDARGTLTGKSITAKTYINAATAISGGAVSAGSDIVSPIITGSSVTAGKDIVATTIAGGAVSAGRDVRAASVSADSATAGRNLVAGSAPAAEQIVLISADQPITPNGSLTASTISAPLVAAGEISDKRGVIGKIETPKLIVVKNAGDNPTTGNFTLNNGSFAFVGAEPVGESGYNADGSIASHSESAWIGGDMSVNNTGSSSFTTLGVGGATRVSGGSLTGDALNTASARLHGGITANITRLNITDPANGFMAVGGASDTGISQVSIANLALNGADLRVGAGGGSARAVIPSFVGKGASGNFTDSDIYVGHNGMLSLGTSNAAWLPGHAASAAMPQDAAILGVAAPFTLGGGLHVDSAWSQPEGSSRARMGRAAGGVEFSPNSLLVIDGATGGVSYTGASVPTAALPASAPGAISSSAPTSANVAGGARIYIDHVTPGHTYVALGRNITTHYADDTAWSGANLLSSNPLLGLERLADGMEGQFGVMEHAPHAKQIAAASGVPRLSRSASEIMESAIYYRIRLGHEDLNRRDWALWALPIYERINEFGLDGGSGSYGYTGGIGGLAIGCDYTWQDIIRVGIALNMGAGYARSTGEVATTKNHLDFWGAGLYGVWKPRSISLDAEVDFTSTYNKLKQDLPAGLPAAELKADAPAWSLGASLRVQYEFDTDWLIIRPHAGVRYFHLDTQPYDVKMNGADVLRSNRYYQNVWTFPVGIVFTKEIKLENGLEITPLINLKAIPASGDTYVKNSIRYTGSEKDLDLETQVMDDITWGGRAGVEFRAGDLSAGINYTAQFGSHTSNQGVFGVLRYEF